MNVLAAPLRAPPLQDLLGASFVFNSAITALAWDRDFACFGLADGAVAMLRAHWDGAPAIAPRAGGGVQIEAGIAPPPPPAIFKPHAGEVLALARDPLGGVISGGADGQVQRLLDGELTLLETRPRRRIAAVTAGRGGRRAFAAGRHAEILGPEAKRLTMPGAVNALAYDPAGLFVAVGYEGGVSLEACGIRRAPKREQPGAHNLLAWHPDGGMVAVAGVQSGVAIRDRAEDDWRTLDGVQGAAKALAFTAAGTLVIAGADFVQFCRPGEAVRQFAQTTGRAPIACHPRQNLVACATADGAILLCRPGTAEAIAVRDPGAAVTFLAFAPDGEALAFAADDGEAGTVMLPDLLFRSGDAA